MAAENTFSGHREAEQMGLLGRSISTSPFSSPIPPIVLTGCGINCLGFFGIGDSLLIWKAILLDHQRERRGKTSYPWIPLHLSVSTPLKVPCNKIATAGIINELE